MARQPVALLRALAGRSLAGRLVAALRLTRARFTEEVDEALRDHLQQRGDARVLRQLRFYLDKQNLSGDVAWRAFKLLLHPGVEAVTLPDLDGLPDGELVLLEAVSLLEPLGASLRTLDARRMPFPDGSAGQEALRTLLVRGGLEGLEVLRVAGATDKLLEDVAMCCPVLRELDMSWGGHVTLRGLRAVIAGPAAKQQYLQVVSLWADDKEENMTALSARDATVLLRGLPQLRSLGRCYPHLAQAAALLLKAKPDHPPLEHMEEPGRGHETTDAEARALARLCPNLKSIYLERPDANAQSLFPNQVGALLRLSDLHRVESVCLTTVDLIEVLESARRLRAAGSPLARLTLCHVLHGGIDLAFLAPLTPHLTELTVRGAVGIRKTAQTMAMKRMIRERKRERKEERRRREEARREKEEQRKRAGTTFAMDDFMSVLCGDDDEDDEEEEEEVHSESDDQDEADDDDDGVIAWPKLRRLDLLPLQDGGVDKATLLHVLRGAPGLRVCNVATTADQFTDADVPSLCPEGNELVDVRLRRDYLNGFGAPSEPAKLRLTVAAARAFLERCPRLATLGLLSDWSVSRAEVEALRRECRQCNLRVELLTCGW